MDIKAPPKLGLSSLEARQRHRQYGPNQIITQEKTSALTEFFSKFANPLTLTLLAVIAVSAILGQWLDAFIILTVVGISVSLDFINSYKSGKAAQSLQNRVKTTAVAIRDGKPVNLPLEHLVPGDVVQLNPGNIIPADATIITSKHFFIDESSLTGEAFPVEKAAQSSVYMGSSVVTGNALATIMKTGRETRFSHIASTLVTRDETDFDKGMKKLSQYILRLILYLSFFVIVVNFFTKHDLLEAVLFAVALAVGLTPELLPMVITLNLTKGALAMSKHGVIVKKLSSIQNFGSMDILCTDKTGTLTENRIELVKCVDASGQHSEEVLEHAYVSCFFETGLDNPLDRAVLDFHDLDVSDFKKLDEVPFDYQRKCSSVIIQKDDKHILVTKGAVDELMSRCAYYRSTHHPMDKNMKVTLYQLYQELSQEGFRVLGVARKPLHSHLKGSAKSQEKEMFFLGFLAFLDPAKKSSKKTLQTIAHYGIEVKILTGDNELVTQKIARDLELPVKGVTTGEQLATLNEAGFLRLVNESTIFARLTPELKLRIIDVLRSQGHVVGYLGDGINDAPALKRADVGISVNNAVDVAKETADLILLEKSLGQLINAVVEGRKVFTNTSKYLMMDLSSNFGNMLSIAGASVFLPFLPMLPSQVLLNNLIYDTSQLAIPADNVDKDDLLTPRRWDINFLRKFMMVFGPVSSVYDFLTFGFLYGILKLNASQFQTGWFLESVMTQIFVIYIIRTKKPLFFLSRPSLILILSTILTAIVCWAFVLTPASQWFKFVSLSTQQYLIIFAIVGLYLFTVSLTKIQFYKVLLKKI